EGRDVLTALVQAAAEGVERPAPGIESLNVRVDDVLASQEFEDEIARLLREAGLEGHIAAAQIAARRPIPGTPEGESAPAPSADGRRTARNVRVDIARLDVLLDLVGELVITRTRIAELCAALARGPVPSELGPVVKALGEAAALLTRTTTEMQEGIRKIRMVPIGTVFERFPRLVRDLARSHGKEIELVVSGAETDLDKTIVEAIGDPLMHLLRNCADHGIEDPQARADAGKPRAGTIALRAFHEGNQIVVIVGDDGAGIDLDKVRTRAVEQGLIAPGEEPDEHELLELIFTPGFSTAERVSDVSGRGVGMDVVRRTILRLSGSFDVGSLRGRGSTFTIRLPLTLAIIRALLVRLAGDLYAFPLDSVVETLRVDPAEVVRGPAGDALDVRGEALPLVDLAEFFELPNAPVRERRKVLVVVARAGDRQAGFVVDDFIGDQEIVIKAISEAVGPIPGISGGTILGDGSIALIIDVNSLIQSALPGALGGFGFGVPA
ncbi:MAG: chemotaxis protein CheA, partial [Candidatus Eremiobacteraeota bacterium]|nr:chemotaxis protein CheA [Candidatus Eremiobacteraeota bacterium]